MPADVVFLLDASASIKANEWEQEKDFVGILIDSLAVERHAINVGMIVYSTEIGQVVDLQPFKNRDQLKAELPKLQQTSQGGWRSRVRPRPRPRPRPCLACPVLSPRPLCACRHVLSSRLCLPETFPSSLSQAEAVKLAVAL